ncbi:FlgD immunoglobulin-like domain containing protein [candidate division KSB1 bacterium]
MKRNMFFKAIMAACIMLLIIVSGIPVSAQDFSQNVQVNDVTSGDQDTDGRRTVAAYGNYVYVVWNDWDNFAIYLSRSTDGGATFDPGIRLSTANYASFPTVKVDNSGNVYAAWALWGSAIEFCKSTDNGQTFSTPITAISGSVNFPIVGVTNSRIYILSVFLTDLGGENYLADYYLTSSTDGGVSFGSPLKVNDATPLSSKVEDVADMCVDASGNIYMVWNDGRRTGGGGDVYFAKSIDNGLTFSANVMINTLSDPNVDELQFGPSVAVSSMGDIYVVWREEPAGGDRNIYFARSTDGGTSFGTQMKINDADETSTKTPSIAVSSSDIICIAFPAYKNLMESLLITQSNNSGLSFTTSATASDNTGGFVSSPSITLDNDDRICAVYSFVGSGPTDSKDVFFAKSAFVTSVEEELIGSPVPGEFILHQNYPNPFNPETTIKYELNSPSEVKISIYNILGQEVKRLVNRNVTAGVHSVKWDGTNEQGIKVNSGVYLYMLQAGDFFETKKMILLR